MDILRKTLLKFGWILVFLAEKKDVWCLVSVVANSLVSGLLRFQIFPKMAALISTNIRHQMALTALLDI